MNNSPKSQLKIPYGLKKIANENKLWGDVLFYYQLKQLRVDGCFDKKNLVYNLAVELQQNRNTIYKKLSRLKKLGWIKSIKSKKQNSFLSLISYDKLWININIPFDKENGLKLIKISSNLDCETINREVNYNEIKKSINNQKKVVRKKARQLLSKTFGYSVKPMARGGIKSLIESEENIGEIIFNGISNQHESIRKSKSTKFDTNWECTLTCQSIAHLLGYTSVMTGWNIAHDLQDYGYIEYISRFNQPIFVTKCSYKSFKAMQLDSSFFFKNKAVYKILPNLINI